MTNLYDQASFIFTANAYSASRLFSIKPTNGTGDLTFSRASACTRITPNGVIELLANNVPALNYSSSLSCPVLQLDPQRTNLVPTSNNFATYTKTGTSVIGNILTEDSSTGTHRLETPFHGGYSTASLYTYSAIIKQSVGTRDVLISVSNGISGDMISQVLNLQTGALSNSFAGHADWSNLSNRVTSLPNGYYLFELSGQTASGSSHRMRVNMISGSTGNYLGNGTSSIEVSHFQSELGAFATSRIITTGASATRIADNLQSQNLGNLTNYTIFFDQLITYDTGSSSIQHIFNNTLGLFFYSVATNVGIRFYNQLNSQHMFGSNSGPINKWIITFNGSIYTLFVNGVKITTYTPPNTVNHVLTSFNTQISSGFLGQRDAAVGIKTISIFNNVLSDAECIALTT